MAVNDYPSIHSGNTIDTRVSQVATNTADIAALKSRMNQAEADLEDKADNASVSSLSSRVNGVEAKIPSSATSSNKLVDKSYVDNALAGKASTSSVSAIEAKIPSAATSSNQLADKAFVNNGLSGKQATLVSGTNIKTVNGESLLGSGDIIAGDPNAVKYVAQTLTSEQQAQARQNIGAASLEDIQTIPRVVKNALYTILQNVAFINDDGYSDELMQIRAWAEDLVLMSISATFTQGTASIYETDSLDKLKQYLVVTATFDDSSTTVLNDSDYSLSGTLTVGTSTITANCQGKTDTFTVVVSASPYLYILPSTFTSTGSNSIDTGFMPEKSKVYTILCECTESTASSTAVFIYGNRKTASSSGYVGLTTQSGNVWGMGITYNGRQSIGSNVFRSVAIMTIDSSGVASISLNYKIGSNAIASSSNSYNADITSSSVVKNFRLGDEIGNGTGFIGAISYFAIYDGEMVSSDIIDFLNNGA